MPRIPRRSKGSEAGPAPQEQRTDGAPPSTEPPTQQMSSGDPLAQTPAELPPAPGAAAPGDPLTSVTPPAADPALTDVDAGMPHTEVVPPAAEAGAVESASGATTGAVAQPPAGEQPTVAAPAVEDAGATGETVVAPDGDAEQAPADARPRFRERTRMRRRLRYLRRLRELAFRDLGGLVFDLHRFGRDRNDLVAAKLEALANIDRELRLLEEALGDRREFTDLREAGIAACPRCGTLHDTDANFCPGCGTSLRTTVVRDAAPVTVTPADEQPPQADPQQPTAAGS